MEIASIKNIRDKKNEIKDRIPEIDKNKFGDTRFGSESEFTFKGWLAGISALMTDVSCLTKAPQEFIKISTYQERQDIFNHLTNLSSYLEEPNYGMSSFDELKKILRNYSVRMKHDRFVEFEHEIGNVLRLKVDLEEAINKTRKVKSQYEKKVADLEELYTKNTTTLNNHELEVKKIEIKTNELIKKNDSLESIIEDVSSVKDQVSSELKVIEELTTESKSNEKLIQNFAQTVTDKEKKLEDLQNRIDDNVKSVGQFKAERIVLLDQAEELIESARQALSYKTAEGISAAFAEKYSEEKKTWKQWIWIVAASAALISTIGIGIWILLDEKATTFHVVLGRIALLPFPIIAAVFCANQYIKRVNLIEDYGYKMVLAKSIVGFSEEIKKHGKDEDNSEYVHYIKTVLEEIHKDPLRSRNIRTRQKKITDISPSLSKDHLDVLDKLVTVLQKIEK